MADLYQQDPREPFLGTTDEDELELLRLWAEAGLTLTELDCMLDVVQNGMEN